MRIERFAGGGTVASVASLSLGDRFNLLRDASNKIATIFNIVSESNKHMSKENALLGVAMPPR